MVKERQTHKLGSGEPPAVCPHCGAGRKILNDLDVRTKLQGLKGRVVSPYTTQKWRVDGKGPPYFKVAGRVLHYEDEFHSWLETKRQTSTSSEAANSASTVEFDGPRAVENTSEPEATDGPWWQEKRD